MATTRNIPLTRFTPERPSRSAVLKAGLDYPVIDTDLHTVEFNPLLEDYIDKFGGAQAVDGFRKIVAAGHGAARGFASSDWYGQSEDERRARRTWRPPWWSLPTRNTLDLATVALPDLLYQRIAESGTDYGILYPNVSLLVTGIGNPELRRALVKAVNTYHADVYAPYADRLTPVAAIPLHTPEEGIEALEHAIGTLKLKVALIPGYVRRPVRSIADKVAFSEVPDLGRFASWIDTFGIDSEYDYDPFWQRALELRAALTTHSSGQGWTARSSYSNFMYNHIGHFADAAHALSKSLFFGGVTRRFPALRIGLLEGGAAWAAQLLADIVGHWEKRNRRDIRNYDPAAIDRAQLARLFREHGRELTRGRLYDEDGIVAAALGGAAGMMVQPQLPGADLDDFARADVQSVEDIVARFVPNFYFGAEADDPTVAHAFNTRVNPGGVKLKAFWASDSGHWDVPDLTEVLAESWALVERGAITEDDFRDLVFTNPYGFYTESNPDFFRGTAVDARVRARKAA